MTVFYHSRRDLEILFTWAAQSTKEMRFKKQRFITGKKKTQYDLKNNYLNIAFRRDLEVISACNSETPLEHFEGHVPTGLAKNRTKNTNLIHEWKHNERLCVLHQLIWQTWNENKSHGTCIKHTLPFTQTCQHPHHELFPPDIRQYQNRSGWRGKNVFLLSCSLAQKILKAQRIQSSAQSIRNGKSDTYFTLHWHIRKYNSLVNHNYNIESPKR